MSKRSVYCTRCKNTYTRKHPGKAGSSIGICPRCKKALKVMDG